MTRHPRPTSDLALRGAVASVVVRRIVASRLAGGAAIDGLFRPGRAPH